MTTVKSETKSLVKKDRENVWHHISAYNEKNPPMIVESGEGAWITDHNGNQVPGWNGWTLVCKRRIRARRACRSCIRANEKNWRMYQ